jgi:hypothetical protein
MREVLGNWNIQILQAQREPFQTGEQVLKYIEEMSGKVRTLPALHRDFRDGGEWIKNMYELTETEVSLLYELYEQQSQKAQKEAAEFQPRYLQKMQMEGLLARLTAYGMDHMDHMNASELLVLTACDSEALAKVLDCDVETARALQQKHIPRLAESKIAMAEYIRDQGTQG